jgi:hypothetical protein
VSWFGHQRTPSRFRTRETDSQESLITVACRDGGTLRFSGADFSYGTGQDMAEAELQRKSRAQRTRRGGARGVARHQDTRKAARCGLSPAIKSVLVATRNINLLLSKTLLRERICVVYQFMDALRRHPEFAVCADVGRNAGCAATSHAMQTHTFRTVRYERLRQRICAQSLGPILEARLTLRGLYRTPVQPSSPPLRLHRPPQPAGILLYFESGGGHGASPYPI